MLFGRNEGKLIPLIKKRILNHARENAQSNNRHFITCNIYS